MDLRLETDSHLEQDKLKVDSLNQNSNQKKKNPKCSQKSNISTHPTGQNPKI